MTRTAHAFATIVVLASSPALGASACTDLGNAAKWVPSMTHEAAYIFVGRVTAVISLSADLGTQVAVLEVQTTLKGSPTFHRVRNTRMGPNFQLMFGVNADLNVTRMSSGFADLVLTHPCLGFHLL